MQRVICMNGIWRRSPMTLLSSPRQGLIFSHISGLRFSAIPSTVAKFADPTPSQMSQTPPGPISVELRIANLIAAELEKPSEAPKSRLPASSNQPEPQGQTSVSRQIRDLSNEYMFLVKSRASYEKQKEVFEKAAALGLTGVRVWGQAILSAGKHEGYNTASKLFADFTKRKLVPDDFIYRALLYCACGEQRWDEVRSRYDEMRQLMRPSAKTYTTVLLHFTRFMRQTEVPVSQSFLAQVHFFYEESKRVEQPDDLLKDLLSQMTGLLARDGQKAPISSNPLATYEASLRGHDDFRNLVSELTRMINAKVKFTIDENKLMSYWRKAIMSLPARHYRPITAGLVQVLGEFKSTANISELLEVLEQEGNEDLEFLYWKTMLAIWQNDFETVIALLSSIVSDSTKVESGSFMRLHQLFSEFRRAMSDKQLGLDVKRQKSYWIVISDMILSLLEPDQPWKDHFDTRFLGEGLIAADRRADVNVSIQMWEKAIAKGVRPDAFCFTVMIGSLARGRQMNKAEELLTMATQARLVIPKQIYVHLYKGFMAIGEPERAKKYQKKEKG